jgi:hypothetical protein
MQSWTLTGKASLMNLSQPVPIPQSPVVFPECLGRIEAGASYLKRLGERRQWGAALSAGSASDKIFHSLYETEVQLTGSYMIPSKQTNAWLFLFQYSNNRNFLNNVPLPGFAYLWNKPERGLQVIAGFPFVSLNYQPGPDWSGRLTLLSFTNQAAEIARKLTGPAWAYIAYQRAPEQWMRAGRDNNSNRLIYDEKKALLGVRSPLGKSFSIELSGGRTFDRRLFESEDASHTGAPRFNLHNGWIASFLLSHRWPQPTVENPPNP